MNNRLKSLIATGLVQAALVYLVVTGLEISARRQAVNKMATIDVAAEKPPPAPRPAHILPPSSAPVFSPAGGGQWATADPVQRNAAFVQIQKWVNENTVSPEDHRLAKWRAAVPQGSGPARVTRVQPANLPTHTLYWPASWSGGPLPIIAWGNGTDNMCSNNSLPYAAFLSEIASHGYFVVAVGNDDIDYPPPDGLEILADGRPIRTQASALKKAVDWAIAENSRAGSPYQGKLDASKIAYMGHACGGQQAITASSDPRTTTTVLLNSAAGFRPGPPDAHKAPIADFAGERDDDGVLDAGDADFAKAQAAGWPMYKAALDGLSHDGAYPGPDRRWSKAVIAWLDWQLKGDTAAAAAFSGNPRAGWSRIGATGL